MRREPLGWSGEAARCDPHISPSSGRLGRAPSRLQAAPCPAPQTRQVGSGPSPRASSAGAQGGTGRSRRPALSHHLRVLSPCAWECPKASRCAKPGGRAAATPWVVIQELLSRPSPTALGVYLSFWSPPVSLSLFFSLGGWDSLSSERSPSSLALRRRSSEGKAVSGVAALSGCATCRPSPCSPDSMEVQSSASLLWEGGCGWLKGR